MKKYLHVINIGIQNTLVYRVNFLFRAAFGLIPLMATIYLWRAVYAGKEDPNVAGYTLGGMISYYLLVTIVDSLTGVTEDDWQIASDIKDGNINQFLVKPIDYMAYRLCLFFSVRLIYTVVAFLPVMLFILYQGKYFVPPDSWAVFPIFLLSLLLTALLQFFMSYTMAMLAFWVSGLPGAARNARIPHVLIPAPRGLRYRTRLHSGRRYARHLRRYPVRR